MLECKGRCHDSCTLIPASELEHRRINAAGKSIGPRMSGRSISARPPPAGRHGARLWARSTTARSTRSGRSSAEPSAWPGTCAANTAASPTKSSPRARSRTSWPASNSSRATSPASALCRCTELTPPGGEARSHSRTRQHSPAAVSLASVAAVLPDPSATAWDAECSAGAPVFGLAVDGADGPGAASVPSWGAGGVVPGDAVAVVVSGAGVGEPVFAGQRREAQSAGCSLSQYATTSSSAGPSLSASLAGSQSLRRQMAMRMPVSLPCKVAA